MINTQQQSQANRNHIFFISKKILRLLLKSFLISLAMLPVFLTFKLNPYLRNDLYANRPHVTLNNLLVTSIPNCLIFNFLCLILHEATFLEGLQDLRGNVISVSKALLMFLTQYWLYVIVFVEVIFFRGMMEILSHFLSLKDLQSMRVYLLGFIMALLFEFFAVTFILCNLKSTHVKRNASNPLPPEKTIVNRFGIIRKKAKQAKGAYLRRLKMSFYSLGPVILCKMLLYLISFTTSAINSPSKLIVGFYCASLVVLKVFFQTLIRFFLSNGNPGGPQFASTTILNCTISFDTVIRIITSQLSSPIELALMLSSLGVSEIVVRSICIFKAVSKREWIQETKVAPTAIGPVHINKKSENDIVLILVEVDADIVSEYVAINTSFLLNFFFNQFEGFVVGKNKSFNLISQLKYVALQYFVEIFVDIISCSLENFHPKIRELAEKQPKLSTLGGVTTNCGIGIFCSSLLILLLIN